VSDNCVTTFKSWQGYRGRILLLIIIIGSKRDQRHRPPMRWAAASRCHMTMAQWSLPVSREEPGTAYTATHVIPETGRKVWHRTITTSEYRVFQVRDVQVHIRVAEVSFTRWLDVRCLHILHHHPSSDRWKLLR
jgi:hypothetical protein